MTGIGFVSFRILPTCARGTEHSLVEGNVGLLDHDTPFFHFGLKQLRKFLRCRTDSHHADVLTGGFRGWSPSFHSHWHSVPRSQGDETLGFDGMTGLET
jgi:hypothetical protein